MKKSYFEVKRGFVECLPKFFVGFSLALGASLGAYGQQVAIGTSTPGSLYHSAGQVVAKLLTEKGGIKATIQPFASPNVFIPAVNAGELQLGFANIADLTWAIEGKEHFSGRPYKDLRAIAIAFPLRSALFVRKDSDIKTIGDLKGRAVVDGYGSQKVILPMLDAMYGTVGLNRNDMKGVQVANVGAGANAFAAGKTEMFFFGLGAAKVREVDASVKGIRMLSLPNTPEAVASIKKHFAPGHLRLEKPGPGNVGVLTPSYSLAYEAFAFGSTKTSDQTAYQVAKVMYENAKEMGVAFPAMRLFDPKTMASDVGLLKYHPGAIKFYKEVGIWPGK